jgi:hypothetical protein
VAAVHPHACGEHCVNLAGTSYPHGSSPRMWGTLLNYTVVSGDWRFIPTHVGNTAHATRAARRLSVHPHACGEHRAAIACPRISVGSSPRMWGTPYCYDGNVADRRFIPTHVGNTLAGATGNTDSTVHPHACGEHTSSISLISL